jgi:hypothetical protein
VPIVACTCPSSQQRHAGLEVAKVPGRPEATFRHGGRSVTCHRVPGASRALTAARSGGRRELVYSSLRPMSVVMALPRQNLLKWQRDVSIIPGPAVHGPGAWRGTPGPLRVRLWTRLRGRKRG